jgi:hypothetical protein
MAEFQLGSISTGTLRPEDLIPAFNNALTQIHDGHYCDIDEMMDDEAGNAAEFGKQPSNDELQRRVVDRLMDELQDACPPFVYFGALEGDGADFGFWPDMDRLNEEIQWVKQTPASDEVVLDDNDPNNPIIVHVSDHGNVTVMDMERNVLWSVA